MRSNRAAHPEPLEQRSLWHALNGRSWLRDCYWA